MHQLPLGQTTRSGPSAGASPVWLWAFVALQIGCQIALLFDSLARFRIIFRSAAFLMSLALLVLLPGKGHAHPAQKWALAIMGIVTLALFHPETYSLFAGIAQWAMYLAILAPIFWVSRLRIDTTTINKLFLTLWIFHTASAFVGVLQIYYPGQFQPAVSVAYTADQLSGLKVTLANGEKVFRPFGLTDQPGGASASGLSVILLSLGLMLSGRSRWVRMAVIGSMAVSLFSIYLSMERANMVIAGICVFTIALVLIQKGDLINGGKVLATTIILGMASFAWAISVGGRSVEERYATLIAGSPDEVYHKNRGIFLEDTFSNVLPTHPLGAGLGRWGMMAFYFQDPDAPDLKTGCMEIQWGGWCLDGGLPLMLCYSLALLQTAWTSWRLAALPLTGSLSTWSTVLVARNVGAMAFTFSYPFFMSQSGMEYWWLNTVVYTAFLNSRKMAKGMVFPRVNGQNIATSNPLVR